jgi:choline dehydrogenase-like flavoprotein
MFLALRLSRQGLKTAVVEAGGESPVATDGRTDLFPHARRGNAAFAVDDNRSIGIGGTSLKWNGVVSRMLPTDFRERAEYGLFDDWPILYDDLAGLYDEAERLLCTRGAPYAPDREPPRPEYADIWPADDGRELNIAELGHLGFFPLAFSMRNQAQPVRLPEEEVPSFTATTDATLIKDRPVTRVLTEGDRVTQVEARRPDGTSESISARYFVLAAGVMETSRLLLTSRSRDFPHGVGNATGLVGRFVNAHPRYRVHIPGAAFASRPVGVFRTYRYADSLRREGFAAACLDLNFYEPNPAIDFTVETEPSPENRVQLDWLRRDRWGRRRAVLTSKRTEVDDRTLARVRELQDELVALVYPRGRKGLVETTTWYHPAGGCRMGRDEETGVVDSDCLVFGTCNLYVCGASTFTTSGAGNPTLTVVAMALRLANCLRERVVPLDAARSA